MIDFTYTWTPPFSKEQKFGKILQFVTVAFDVYAMMLNESGRVEQVRYNFLQAIANPPSSSSNPSSASEKSLTPSIDS